MKHEANGLHTIIWKFSPEEYGELDPIWNGTHPEDRLPLEVRDEMPPGFPWPGSREEAQFCAPAELDPAMLAHYSKVLDAKRSGPTSRDTRVCG